MPKTCLAEGYAGESETGGYADGEREQSHWHEGRMIVAQHDRCYPAAALMPFFAFPATWCGAWAWTVFVAAVFVGAMCLIARSWWPLILLGSMPVLFNLERGNPIGLAAAGVGIFLAWYRSPQRWQRVAAAFALSMATCFKISPALLGLLYVDFSRVTTDGWRGVTIDGRGIGWCMTFGAMLFLVPWLFVPDGFAALPVMMENAKGNFMEYARAAEFGLVDLWRGVRVVLRQDCMHLWPGCLAVTRLSQAMGLAAVAWGAWKRRPLPMVVGMLWAAGNMHYYGALYLLPVFVSKMGEGKIGGWKQVLLWLVILCPLQLMVLGHSANAIMANLAAVGLVVGERLKVGG